jgi:hypothetical protein
MRRGIRALRIEFSDVLFFSIFKYFLRGPTLAEAIRPGDRRWLGGVEL